MTSADEPGATLVAELPLADPRRERLTRAGHLRWYHWGVVGLSVLLTFGVARLVDIQTERESRARFDRAAEHNVELVIERLAKYEDALWGGVGAIRARGRAMDLAAWRRFADTLEIDVKYPGINGIGVIHRVPADELDDYLARQRIDRPDFAIHPERIDDEYLPITFIEPQGPNAAAVGLDMRHEENRLRGALAARDSGRARITGPIVLVQDDRKTPGFLFYAPFYAVFYDDDATARVTDSTGLVYAPFIVERLMRGVLSKERRSIGLRVTDGDETIYDEHVETEVDFDPSSAYRRVIGKEVYGRRWTFDIRATRAFRESVVSYGPLAILVGGLSLDAMLLALFLGMGRANRRALRLADDLTAELREKSAELERSNTDLQLFASIASHDLQEPLRMISGFTRLLQQRYGGQLDADADRYIGFAVDGSIRMQLLLEELLNYARVGERDTNVVSFDAAMACREAVERLRLALDECEGRVDIGELPVVKADRSQLLQVLQNLLSNALKFRVDGRPPHIRVTCSESDTEWHFAVADNGVGIAPEYLTKVFVMFQRLNNRSEYAGSGIGLALCRKVVLRHGGRIWLESEPDVGTTVHFTIEKPSEDD